MFNEVLAWPTFYASEIKDPLVRGYVNSARRYALAQKVPSEAVKEFSGDLGRIEPSLFEKRYGVPAARIAHHSRNGKVDELFGEVRSQLKELGADLCKAESYWNGIFEEVITKYFKGSGKQIRGALAKSRWYPFLAMSQKRVYNPTLCNEYCGVYFSPTDSKEKKRLARLAKSVLGSQEGLGWLYILESFRTGGDPHGLVIDKVQKPKIISNTKFEIPKLPDSTMEFLLEGTGSENDWLLARLAALYSCAKDAASGEVTALQDVFSIYPEVAQELEKMGDSAFRRDLGAWWAKVRKAMRVVQRHGPQSFYPLDFLPAFLANLYFMGSHYREEMEKADGVLFDTSLVGLPGTILYAKPKEHGELMGLLGTLGAIEHAKDLYFVRFSR